MFDVHIRLSTVLSILFCSVAGSEGVPLYFGQRYPQLRNSPTGSTEFTESFFNYLRNSSSLISESIVDNDTITLEAILGVDDLWRPRSSLVIDGEQSMEFAKRQYYWSDETIKDSQDFIWICGFSLKGNTEMLHQEVCLQNGTSAEQIFFGCGSGTDCCGLDCCNDDVIFNIFIVVVISVALIFLLVCNVIIGFKKRRTGRRNHEVLYEVPKAGAASSGGANRSDEEIGESQIQIRTTN